MRATFAALIACAALAPGAFAQLKPGASRNLSAAEIKAALFGVDMEGYSPSYAFSWRECIDPDGETLYETPAGVMKGKLTVLEGNACFSYEDDGYSDMACFRVTRSPTGFTFDGDFADIFVTTRVVTGVRSCKPLDDLIG